MIFHVSKSWDPRTRPLTLPHTSPTKATLMYRGWELQATTLHAPRCSARLLSFRKSWIPLPRIRNTIGLSKLRAKSCTSLHLFRSPTIQFAPTVRWSRHGGSKAQVSGRAPFATGSRSGFPRKQSHLARSTSPSSRQLRKQTTWPIANKRRGRLPPQKKKKKQHKRKKHDNLIYSSTRTGTHMTTWPSYMPLVPSRTYGPHDLS